MNEEQWHRVGELFHAALEVEPFARAQWLADACGGDSELLQEVQNLLNSDDEIDTGFIEAGMAPVVESLLRGPERVGPYRLLRELGRGGMGTVYLAERDDAEYRAQVAVKLVRQGMDTAVVLSRFFRERQTLARLQHPNIARLLDGGTTQTGVPYLVMEYVDGVKITDYCRQQSLSIRGRLALFQKVCTAVEYAHRKFVVHRDLKPGNILVSQDGEVKLLDFGICKLLQTEGPFLEDTRATQALLTPEYASPEQVLGQPVTITSDVYSAGAVLYELLTGAKPHQIAEHSLRGLENAICHRPVPLPSEASSEPSLSRELRGDLDTILQVAMNKDPARRYGSMEGFSEDIRRFLAFEPIKARPDSTLYRLTRFVQRRSSLVAAIALILLVASLGAFFSLRSARKAESNLRLARQLANTFVIDVYDLVRDLPGATLAKEEIVSTGLRYLDNLNEISGGDPELKAELAVAYRRIGDVQGEVLSANLGKSKEALVSYRKSLSLLEEVRAERGDQPSILIDIITAHRRIADILELSKDASAADSYAKAHQLAEALYQIQPDDSKVRRTLVGVFVSMANTARSDGRTAEARVAYSRARDLLELEERISPDDPYVQSSLSAAYGGLGMCDSRLGKLHESLAWYRQALPRSQKLVRLQPDSVPYRRQLMLTYSHIGDVLGNPNLINLGDPEGATEAYSGMLREAKHLYDADPANQRARNDYGIALTRTATASTQPSSKIALLRESIAVYQEVVRINPSNASAMADMVYAQLFLGDAFLEAGKPDDAIQAYRECLRLSTPLLDKGSPGVLVGNLRALQSLGIQLAQRGQSQDALQLAERALAVGDPAGPIAGGRPESSRSHLWPRALMTAGLIETAAGHSAPAREHLQKAADLYAQFDTASGGNRLLPKEKAALTNALEALR